jgi:hypothetical protein
MITRVVDEYSAHDRVKIVRVLVVYSDTRFIFECLTNPTLEKIFVEV